MNYGITVPLDQLPAYRAVLKERGIVYEEVLFNTSAVVYITADLKTHGEIIAHVKQQLHERTDRTD